VDAKRFDLPFVRRVSDAPRSNGIQELALVQHLPEGIVDQVILGEEVLQRGRVASQNGGAGLIVESADLVLVRPHVG
jgi:hypothetical protein